jgi:hypothetical protein
MAMANTNILIKRSASTSRPSSLAAGELGYSYLSNTLFLGTAAGNGVINVGGIYYTQSIDNATDAVVAGTLVKRDATGNASFNFITANIIGSIQTATAASQLTNARDFSISGGDISASAISFNGTGNVTLNASLNAIPGLSAGAYGSSTEIPVVTVAANGRVTAISTQSISTSFTLTGDTGTTTISGGDTLTVTGGVGITSNVSGDQVTFDVDNTVVRSNTAITSQTIDGNITIAGNLTVQGVHTTVNTSTLNVVDPLIILASNNTSDAVDIGFAAHYNDGSTNRHTGFFRDAGTKEYYVFDGYTPELTGNSIDVANASFNRANVNAGYVKGNLIATTATSDGFYGNAGAVLNLYPNASYAASGNQYIIVDPTAANHIHLRAGGTIDGSTAELFLGGENTSVQVSDTTKEVYIRANNSHLWTFGDDGVLNLPGTIESTTGTVTINDNITVTGLSTVANVIPSGNNTQSLGSPTNRFKDLFLSGDTLDIGGAVLRANNGTFTVTSANGTSFQLKGTGPGDSRLETDKVLVHSLTTPGQIVIAGTLGNLTPLSNSSYTLTGSLSASKTLTSLTVDAYGRTTAATGADIAIDASQITTGILEYARGGTGSASYATGGILIAGASGFESLANSSYTATGTAAANNTLSSLTVDAYGRVTAATFSAISGLTVAQGGTGRSTFTTNGIIYGNSTDGQLVTAAAGTADQTWSNQILTVTNAGVPVWSSALDGGTF